MSMDKKVMEALGGGVMVNARLSSAPPELSASCAAANQVCDGMDRPTVEKKSRAR